MKASYISNIFTELSYKSLLLRSQLCSSEDTSLTTTTGEKLDSSTQLCLEL